MGTGSAGGSEALDLDVLRLQRLVQIVQFLSVADVDGRAFGAVLVYPFGVGHLQTDAAGRGPFAESGDGAGADGMVPVVQRRMEVIAAAIDGWPANGVAAGARVGVPFALVALDLPGAVPGAIIGPAGGADHVNIICKL